MLQGVFAVYSSVGIDLKALYQQITKFLVLCKNLLKTFKVVDVPPWTEVRFSLLMRNRVFLKNLPELRLSLFYHPVREFPWVFLDHEEVFEIVVCLEEQLPSEELCYNAANWPHIGQFVPLTTFHDDFRRTVLTSADDRTVKLIVLCCTSEIYHSDPVWLWQVNLLWLIFESLKHEQILIFKQNILWL